MAYNLTTLIQEVARLRFTGQTSLNLGVGGPAQWIQQIEAEVWAAADWPWKRVGPTNVTLTANQDFISAGNMPAAFRRVTDLFDDTGDQLEWLDEETFASIHVPNATARGRPSIFTVINGVIFLDPTPASAYVFKMSYRRQLCHLDSGGAVTVGGMSQGSDFPIFPADHQYGTLVSGALWRGKIDERDPSAKDDFTAYQNALGLMMAEHLPDRPIGRRLQYGRDPL